METIYLFTTTRNRLYKRDLLNVCCFPDDWTIEFGYKSDYVPTHLSSDIQEKLDGHPAVIVFCEPIDDGDTYYRYYPIRRGTIGKARKDLAGCLTIPIMLASVFNYSASDWLPRVDGFQAFVGGSEDRPRTLRSERLSGKKNIFIRSASSCLADDCWQPWTRYWYALTTHFCERKGLDDAYFLRIEAAAEGGADQGRDAFPRARHDGRGRPRWLLIAGTTYNLCCELRVGSNAGRAVPMVTTGSELVSVLGPFERQSGDGTNVEFLVAPRRAFQTDYSVFKMRVEPDKDGKERSSEFGGVLEIRPRRGLLPWTLFLLVGGTLLMSLDSALMDKWFGKLESASRYWNGSTVLWAAKAVGMAALSIGGYLGFRKLPIKS